MQGFLPMMRTMGDCGRKVVSLSLWGSREEYVRGAIEVVRQLPEIYPEWEAWVFISHDVPGAVADELGAMGACVHKMGRAQLYAGGFWRFLAAADPSVALMISRDADSRLTMREAAAVEEWISSGASFHIMRDHPGHLTPVMAGMWGCRCDRLRDIESLINGWRNQWKYGSDQHFLAKVIYPRMKGDLLVHSEVVAFTGEEPRPFPTPRVGLEFVGRAERGSEIQISQEEGLAAWLRGGCRTVVLPLPSSARGRLRRLQIICRGAWDDLLRLFRLKPDYWG
jgi:hypothetical protein